MVSNQQGIKDPQWQFPDLYSSTDVTPDPTALELSEGTKHRPDNTSEKELTDLHRQPAGQPRSRNAAGKSLLQYVNGPFNIEHTMHFHLHWMQGL